MNFPMPGSVIKITLTHFMPRCDHIETEGFTKVNKIMKHLKEMEGQPFHITKLEIEELL